MNKHFTKVVLSLLGAVLLFASVPLFASAQTSIGLQLKPAVVEDKVAPGEVHQYSLTATNITQTKTTFYLITQDIKGEDEGGRPIFSSNPEVTGYELSSWITLPNETITLSPGETRTVSFSVAIPAGASPGSHFAGVFFSDKPISPGNSGSGVGFNVGAIVSLRIAGDIHEEAQLREFSTNKFIYATPDVSFNTKVQNLGNVLVQPTGSVEVSNMFGNKVATVSVNENLASVFPNANRAYITEWKDSGFAFGRYQAIVSLVYGDEERKTIYSTTSFWVLPLVPIFTVLGGILLIILVVFGLMKAYVQKKLRQMGVNNATRADSDFYRRKYQKSSSKLMVITLAIILLIVVFLIILFLMFA